LNEEQLLKDIANDPQQFSQVYEAFYSRIFGYAYRRTTDFEAAGDITAETFLKAYVSIGKFKWRNISLLYWLYSIATNELNKYFNSHKYKPYSLNRIQEEYGMDIRNQAPSESILLREELEKHQDFMRVNEAVKKLDMKYQDVIALRFFEQKSIREIATILQKKEGTVKSLLSRGIEKLKETIKN
jgi:RNA polymerase sigma-70 factor, ECF subfamily